MSVGSEADCESVVRLFGHFGLKCWLRVHSELFPRAAKFTGPSFPGDDRVSGGKLTFGFGADMVTIEPMVKTGKWNKSMQKHRFTANEGEKFDCATQTNFTTKRVMKRILVGLAVIIGLSGLAFAERGLSISAKEKRTALVIGNSDYKIGRLKNPANDADDMAGLLKRKGFRVTLLRNASQRRMEKAIRQFGKDLRNGGVGLFFYAGHGMQVDGVNYLIPIGADIEAEEDIKFESVDANRVLAKMEKAGNRLNIIFLDACRNNPFARSFRSTNKGLAVMDAPSGSLISFATAPGKTASDGDGRNGLFTGYLLDYMKQPGLPLTRMMMEVRKKVLKDSDKKQTPWDVSSLTGDFYFSGRRSAGTASASPAKTPTATINAEEELWRDVRDSKSIRDLQDYLSVYPNGRFAANARIKIRRLKRSKRKPKPVVKTRPPSKPKGGDKVVDGATGLMWQQGDPGRRKWRAAMNYCAGLSFAGHSDWRLPDKDELRGLYRRRTILKNYSPSLYWSSTTYAENTYNAWYVSFYNGGVSKYDQSGNFYVRCVRGGR